MGVGGILSIVVDHQQDNVHMTAEETLELGICVQAGVVLVNANVLQVTEINNGLKVGQTMKVASNVLLVHIPGWLLI